MDIKDYQETVDKWIKEIGVRYFDPMTNTALLMEEVGEMARLLARLYGEQSFKKETDPTEAHQKLADEMADVFFVLTCLANQSGVDLTKAIERNLEKKTNRDKDRHKNNAKLSK